MAESVGCSPFEMACGEQVKLPIDVIVGTQGKMPDVTHFAQHILVSSSGCQEPLEESIGLLEALL